MPQPSTIAITIAVLLVMSFPAWGPYAVYRLKDKIQDRLLRDIATATITIWATNVGLVDFVIILLTLLALTTTKDTNPVQFSDFLPIWDVAKVVLGISLIGNLISVALAFRNRDKGNAAGSYDAFFIYQCAYVVPFIVCLTGAVVYLAIKFALLVATSLS